MPCINGKMGENVDYELAGLVIKFCYLIVVLGKIQIDKWNFSYWITNIEYVILWYWMACVGIISHI